jgi:hypothetical protein
MSGYLNRLIHNYNKDILFCWGYAALITIAEIVGGYGNIIIGMAVHAGLLAAILAHSFRLKSRAWFLLWFITDS